MVTEDNIEDEISTKETEEGAAEEELNITEQIKQLNFQTLKSPKGFDSDVNKQVFSKEVTGTTTPTTTTLKPSSIKPSLFTTNIERFRYFCKDYPSRDLFIDFNFRFLISACLARRCWVGELKGKPIFPNLYPIFVARPGMGKTITSATVAQILESLVDTVLDRSSNKLVNLKLLNLGPDAITWEKLVYRASRSVDTAKDINGKTYVHSSTTFCLCDEIDMLFNNESSKVVSLLNKGYDCGNFENDTYKHDLQNINNMCFNFLGCTAPKLMKDLMRRGILNSGFTARAMFLYADRKRKHPPNILHAAEQFNEIEHLRQHLRKLAKMPPTQLVFSDEALNWLNKWHEKFENVDSSTHFRINKSPLLDDYYARRMTHMKKLAINFAASDQIPKVIEIIDLINADKLLNDAEVDMHKALCGSGENPLVGLTDGIKTYLVEHGPTSRRKLILQFFAESKDGVESINQVLDYLINTGQCMAKQVGNVEGVCIKKEGGGDE